MPAPASFDVAVIGGGAAGLFCAAVAGSRGRKVVVLERSDRTGKKILISGGGRCNFTNLGTAPENFLSANPDFAKSALARYTPQDFVELVRKHRIPFYEKKLGQLFCDRSASDITGLLETECAAGGVSIHANCSVEAIRRDTRFVIDSSVGEIEAAAVVIASGGLSIPKIGATDFGYRIAKQFGHKIRPPYPALVPLTFDEEWLQRFAGLAGVSAEVAATVGRQSFFERMLFTHRGLSGPAILQISSYWRKPDGVRIELLDEHPPRRLVPHLPHPDQRELEWFPSGTEGFAKAEVTGGGVDTDGLSSRTMESKLVPGLFFVGEVVDVTGHLGGYNFQWAWASAHACASAL